MYESHYEKTTMKTTMPSLMPQVENIILSEVVCKIAFPRCNVLVGISYGQRTDQMVSCEVIVQDNQFHHTTRSHD